MGYQLRLKEIRISRGLKQEEVASMLKMSLSTYRSWEQGVSKLTLENAYKIALTLGCTPNDLCGWPIGKNEGLIWNDRYEEELLRCYRFSTPKRKDRILDTARDAAAMSKDATKHSASESKLDEAI